jgi:hypothetical protein
MFTKILHFLGIVVIAVIVFEIVKLVLLALGFAIPAIIITLLGLLIIIAVVIFGIRLFGLDI